MDEEKMDEDFGVPPATRNLGQYFTVLCRLRLGQKQDESGSYSCPLCAQDITEDPYRRHPLACMAGGHRTNVHNEFRRTLSSLMSVALMGPREETVCFLSDQNLRADITYSTPSVSGADTLNIVDLAFTSPFIGGHRAAATKLPGGAATLYESKKREKYLPYVDHSTQKFLPVVGDVLGAWGRTALSFLQDTASAYAKRYPHLIAAKVHFYSTLNTQLMRQIAAIIHRSITPLEA